MQRCFQLALKGQGRVSPNPMVGAVLVHEHRIIGEGFHQQYGESHAEVNCLASVAETDKQWIASSTLYVSLEPCSHFGKTPPCADLIIRHGIPRVVISVTDPSEKVAGKGILRLRDAGIEVTTGILEREGRQINQRFFTHTLLQRPYVILKWAQSEDGYLSAKGKQSKLSNAYSDRLVHQWRHEEDAISVGYRTAMIDDPQLNCRLFPGKDPLRVIYDRDLSLPATLHLFDHRQSTIVYNLKDDRTEDKLIHHRLEAQNTLPQLLRDLAARNISSMLVEGGASWLNEFLIHDLWDEIRVIQTPVMLNDGVLAPALPNQAQLTDTITLMNDQISFYRRAETVL
ncbi:MAG: bifunctional diaminohydroxyphosphoribosylaminopyrimidine deaminase/5-amino-6-(5-phosphoribosylamino)uracil reductase RibD [Chitinophagaceae bacterium]|nr:bifunctional diaminohydroxyphosphoribosylaminopyrimidine deaminase/5-amino-6-(5-phosphoribosylamino)uracil reductase RibD [Chitinophagaceae bacterium]